MPNKILALGLVAVGVFVGVLRADEHDKKTTLTVNEPLIVPGHQLQPGKYVMKLANSQSDRHIVQIFNEDQSQLIATIFAIADTRTTRTDDTALMYWETPAGPALRSWFWPGDFDGQAFAYPKETADRIVAANRAAQVPVVDDSGNLVKGSSTTEVAEHRAANPDTFAERRDPSVGRGPLAESTAPPVVTPQPGPAERPRQDNTLLAQNQPAPNPVQPAAPANNNPNTRELPATASPLGWMIAAGFASLAGAFMLRRLAMNS